jgi:DNA-binding response OmpR family regulator
LRVLVVEDSPVIRQSVAQALRESGYAVDVAPDGRKGLIHGRTSDYDAIVLDIGLPEIDGLSVLRQLRDKSVATPVLLLTARDAVDDRVLGLRSGADDYLVKPFALAELIARVAALIRRSKGVSGTTIRIGPLVIDSQTKTVRVDDGGVLELPPREYALLEYLAHRVGVPVPRHELEEHLYDDSSRVQSNTVDSAVCALRATLDAAGCPGLIRTRRKLGYLLQAEDHA